MSKQISVHCSVHNKAGYLLKCLIAWQSLSVSCTKHMNSLFFEWNHTRGGKIKYDSHFMYQYSLDYDQCSICSPLFFSIYVVQLQERIPTKADPSAKMPAKAGPSATSMNQVEGRSVKKDAQISCWWNQCCICRFSFY